MVDQASGTHSGPEGDQVCLKAALRGTFDVSVMNFGSYNILYAANVNADGGRRHGQERAVETVQDGVSVAEDLLVGYRRSPMELVLCPVDLTEALPRAAGDLQEAPVISVPLAVNMTNLAGMAADGRTVAITLSTGHQVVLEVQPSVHFSDLPQALLDQSRDVQDFYDFVDLFMDTLEGMSSI